MVGPLFNVTGAEFELVTDYDQQLFLQKELCGGISMAPKRFSRANNPLFVCYNNKKPKVTYFTLMQTISTYGRFPKGGGL